MNNAKRNTKRSNNRTNRNPLNRAILNNIRRKRNTQEKNKGGPRGGARAGTAGAKPRDPATIIANLSRSFVSAPTVDHPYLGARLNPFVSAAHAYPDGQNQNYICVDYHVANSLTSVPTSFVLQTLPLAPSFSAIASTAGPITVDGVVSAASTAYTPNEITALTTWYPTSILPPLANYYSLLGGINTDPFNATKARMIICGYRIIYTGPTSTCSGSICVTPNNITLSQQSITTTNAAAAGTAISCQQLGNDGATVRNYATQNAPLYCIELSVNSAALTKESKTFRPEESIVILPRYLAQTNLPSDVFPGAMPLVGNVGSLNGPLNLTNFFRSSNANVNGIIWMDDNWESYQIVFNGINSDASYRIETVVCVEMSLQQNSVYAPLSKERSPYNKNATDMAMKLNEMVPPVMSARQQEDVIRTVPYRLGRTGVRTTPYSI
jgi:hypothetical protein